MLADRSPRGSPGSPGQPADFLTQPSGMSFTSHPAPQDPAAGASMAQRLSAKMPFVSATAGLLSVGAETKGESRIGQIFQVWCCWHGCGTFTIAGEVRRLILCCGSATGSKHCNALMWGIVVPQWIAILLKWRHTLQPVCCSHQLWWLLCTNTSGCTHKPGESVYRCILQKLLRKSTMHKFVSSESCTRSTHAEPMMLVTPGSSVKHTQMQQ